MAAVGIFDRVAGLPMVQSTYGKVSEVYCSAKERNSLVNFALATMEASVQVVATSAQPIVNTLERPIAHADAFACRQFELLEEKVPAIQATPEEVIAGTKQFVSDKLQAGAEVVSSTPVAKLVSSRLCHVLNATENAVDYYLPEGEQDIRAPVVPEDEEDEDDIIEPAVPSNLSRLSSISSKVSTRTQALAVQQLHKAQIRATATLEELRGNLVVINQAQEYMREQRNRVTCLIEEGRSSARAQVAASSQRIATAVHGHSQTLRSGISSAQSAIASSIPATVQLPNGTVVHFDTMLQTMTRLTASTQASLQTLAALARHMPSHLHRPVELALEQSRVLNNMVQEIARGNPLTSAMLDKASSLITTISTATNDIRIFILTRFQLQRPESADDMEMEAEAESLPTKAILPIGKKGLEEGELEDDEDDGSTEI